MILLKNTKAAIAAVIIALFLLSSCEEQQKLEREQQALQRSRNSLQQQLDSIHNRKQEHIYYREQETPFHESYPLLLEPHPGNK